MFFAFSILSAFYNSSVYSMASKTDAKKIDIFKAAVTGNVVRMQELILAKVYLNQRNGNGATPLHVAVFHGHIAIVKALIAAKADPCVLDHNGNTPLQLVSAYGDPNLIELLRKDHREHAQAKSEIREEVTFDSLIKYHQERAEATEKAGQLAQDEQRHNKGRCWCDGDEGSF